MRALLRSGSLLAFVVAFGAVTPARADDAAAASAAAREHYQKGTSFYDLGRYADAIKEFEAAYEIKNDPALLYNLAQSNRLAGNSEQALHFYRTYLRYVPKATNRTEIEERIKQLDQLVAQKSAVQTAPPAQVAPPENVAPPLQTAPPPPPPAVPPSEPAPPLGAPPVGAPSAVAPPFSTAPPATFPLPPQAAPDDHHRMILAGELTAAAGGLLFIVGAAYGAAAVGAANEVNNEAKNGQPFDPSIEKRGKSDQTAEAVLLSLGALTGVAGGVLYFYGRHLASQEAHASLMPVASARGAGLSLQVTF
ncbi:MAG TPA: tetratricopeptide repeat protein [Polyangia bacterium]|jgi:tetratricopeptide (TPR) repeat protein